MNLVSSYYKFRWDLFLWFHPLSIVYVNLKFWKYFNLVVLIRKNNDHTILDPKCSKDSKDAIFFPSNPLWMRNCNLNTDLVMWPLVIICSAQSIYFLLRKEYINLTTVDLSFWKYEKIYKQKTFFLSRMHFCIISSFVRRGTGRRYDLNTSLTYEMRKNFLRNHWTTNTLCFEELLHTLE